MENQKFEPKEETNQQWSNHQYYQAPVHYNYPKKKLYRSTSNKWVAGVCGGLAEHFDADPTLIRLLWIIVTIFSAGIGIIGYLLFWIMVDKYPSYYQLNRSWVTQDQHGALHYHYHYKTTR